MIALIIKSYLAILLPVAIGSMLIFVTGLWWILGKTSSADAKLPLPEMSPVDLTAIAGEDVMATQLDLARAYIETNNIDLAKNILQMVIAQGNSTQQEEAQQLLSSTV